MNKLFRALTAAWGAKKPEGGCFSGIGIFIVIYFLLGRWNNRWAVVSPAFQQRPVVVCGKAGS